MGAGAFPRGAYTVLAAVSRSYSVPIGRFPRVTHPCASFDRSLTFDLHVLGLPPAFALSQDQTLRLTAPNRHPPKGLPARASLSSLEARGIQGAQAPNDPKVAGSCFTRMLEQRSKKHAPPPAHPFHLFTFQRAAHNRTRRRTNKAFCRARPAVVQDVSRPAGRGL